MPRHDGLLQQSLLPVDASLPFDASLSDLVASGMPLQGQELQGEEQLVDAHAQQANAQTQLGPVLGVIVSGSPRPKYNSVYTPAGEYEGWRRFESHQGIHLYRDVKLKRWRLDDEFDPEDRRALDGGRVGTATLYGYAHAEDGLVPEGEREWQLSTAHIGGNGYNTAHLTVTLLRTEDELHEAREKQRLEDEQLRAEAQWRCGDYVLALLFAAIGILFIGLALAPGLDIRDEGCPAAPSALCSYNDSVAIGRQTSALAAVWVGGQLDTNVLHRGQYCLTACKNQQGPCSWCGSGVCVKDRGGGFGYVCSDPIGREACCAACQAHSGCIAATYYNNTDVMQNCFLYGSDANGATRIPFTSASVCSPPQASIISATRAELENKLHDLLGASAILGRFGGYVLISLRNHLMKIAGYGGAGIGQSMLKPRLAAATSKALRSAENDVHGVWHTEAPWEASWAAIVNYPDQPLTTWNMARRALGLSVRQALWSSGTKLLLWHWTQPLCYLAVFGAYYCSLNNSQPVQQELGMLVAYREVTYLLCTLLAMWYNPAFLLMEIASVWSGQERVSRLPDAEALKHWTLYLMAPHTYVAQCVRPFHKNTCCCCEFLWIGVRMLLVFADFISVLALWLLLLEPSPPAALAIGYWLTAAGYAFFGWNSAVVFVCHRLGNRGMCGDGWGWYMWLLHDIVMLVGMGIPLVALLMLTTYPVVVAPFQLIGISHGFALG